jgi:hypothetical protein
MASRTSQSRAVKNYRQRLSEKGMQRYEVLGLEKDRQLVRSVAKRLAKDDADADRLREELNRTVSPQWSERGAIWAALRRSPLVGVELNLTREKSSGRDIKL